MPRSAAAVVLLLLLVSACSKPAATSGLDAQPSGSPAPRGDLSEARLRGLLLTSGDLPGTASRREFAGVDLTTQPTPQLALCKGQVPVPPHQLASVIAKPGKPGDVQTFELVSAFATPAGAAQAFDAAIADAKGCSAYKVDGVAFAVQDLATLDVATPARAAHYRVMTADVLSRDSRTVLQSGRFFVLLSGFGIPPAGQNLLDYQAAVARKALTRLR